MGPVARADRWIVQLLPDVFWGFRKGTFDLAESAVIDRIRKEIRMYLVERGSLALAEQVAWMAPNDLIAYVRHNL